MPKAGSQDKKKTTARGRASERVTERRRAPQSPTIPRSNKRSSQSRFPGESPLTGEDRPANRRGRKKENQSSARKRKQENLTTPFRQPAEVILSKRSLTRGGS